MLKPNAVEPPGIELPPILPPSACPFPDLSDVLNRTIGMQHINDFVARFRYALLVCKTFTTYKHEILFLAYQSVLYGGRNII
jgi:hypothetical protein